MTYGSKPADENTYAAIVPPGASDRRARPSRRVIETLWPDDPRSIETLGEIVGYILAGDNHFQKMFLLVGPPRSGKGTIGRILVKLLGGRGHVGLPLGSLNGDFGLQPLLGKMLAIVPDARLSGRSHTIVERLLAISGGDDLTVGRKNTTSVTVRLPARFVFLTNVVPALADASGTIASRFIVLTFTESFLGKEDLALEGRLTAELPGIFNWAMAGWRRLLARGRFIQPESGTKSALSLAFLASPMKQFIEENYERKPEYEVGTAEVFEHWQLWWDQSGQQGHPGNETSFGMRLAAAYPNIRKERRQDGGARWYFYAGMRRRYDPSPDGAEGGQQEAGERELAEPPF